MAIDGISGAVPSAQFNRGFDTLPAAASAPPASSNAAVAGWNGQSGFDSRPSGAGPAQAPAGPSQQQWNDFFNAGWTEGHSAAYDGRAPRALDQDGQVDPALQGAYSLGVQRGLEYGNNELAAAIEAQAAANQAPAAPQADPILGQAQGYLGNQRAGDASTDGWCLGWVHGQYAASRGGEDSTVLQAPSAADALARARAAGVTVNTDFSNVPPGAIVFWDRGANGTGQDGHVAIATGTTDTNGSPNVLTTTGWNASNGTPRHGVQELSLAQIKADGIYPQLAGWVDPADLQGR